MEVIKILLTTICFMVYIFSLGNLREIGKKEWIYGICASFSAVLYSIIIIFM